MMPRPSALRHFNCASEMPFLLESFQEASNITVSSFPPVAKAFETFENMVRPTGMLNEGMMCTLRAATVPIVLNMADGIHVDMHHLKTGEVKYMIHTSSFSFIANPNTVSEPLCTSSSILLPPSSPSTPRLSKADFVPSSFQHGNQLPRRRHPRRRLPYHHRRLHCQPCNR